MEPWIAHVFYGLMLFFSLLVYFLFSCNTWFYLFSCFAWIARRRSFLLPISNTHNTSINRLKTILSLHSNTTWKHFLVHLQEYIIYFKPVASWIMIITLWTLRFIETLGLFNVVVSYLTACIVPCSERSYINSLCL